ncbi:hypothetical protein HJG60_010673 [Phyllostomus discolor]|uniref:Uncharacterized protein n=1 Tax=Phyllostomus discolor TaxID=89673 RepID=A0A834EF47_9CHIR|nr:hypothetical protein HJG60_010673 [Phyllostomus discolor]
MFWFTEPADFWLDFLTSQLWLSREAEVVAVNPKEKSMFTSLSEKLAHQNVSVQSAQPLLSRDHSGWTFSSLPTALLPTQGTVTSHRQRKHTDSLYPSHPIFENIKGHVCAHVYMCVRVCMYMS